MQANMEERAAPSWQAFIKQMKAMCLLKSAMMALALKKNISPGYLKDFIAPMQAEAVTVAAPGLASLSANILLKRMDSVFMCAAHLMLGLLLDLHWKGRGNSSKLYFLAKNKVIE